MRQYASELEKFKINLVKFATSEDSDIENKIFSDVRKKLLTNPQLESLIPEYLKVCRDLQEFWQYIKSVDSTYQGRRNHIAETFNPIIDYFDISPEQSNFNSDYDKQESLGSGGFGEVFRYHNKVLDMDFAIKFFSPSFPVDTEKDRIRFFQEAKILFELNHENIISVYDIGLLNGKPFIRMEYFKGKNLNEVLKDYGTLSRDKVTVLIKNVVDAMAYAHKIVVHRDLKPSNIMVAKPNKFRIIDFGLGIYREKQLYSRLTTFGKAPAGGLYTAPELNDDPTIVDKRSDIYSIGAIWYTMLVGRAPSGSQLHQNLLNVNGVDDDYAALIFKCLNNIDERYKDLEELAADLVRFMGTDSSFA